MVSLMLMGVVYTSCGDDDEDAPAQVTEYTISYDANGGTGTVPSTTYKEGDKVTLSNGKELSREGYAFAGWSSTPDGTSFDVSAFKGQNVTLYAVWTKIEGGDNNGGDNNGGDNNGENNGNDNPEVVEVKAVFTVSPTVQMQPSMNVICYADSIPGDDISYEWNFGDGIGSVWANNNEYLKTLVHTYETYGEYTITLTVKSKDKSDVATQTIKIQPAPPTLIINPTKYDGVAPYTMTFEEGVMYIESVKWTIYRVENKQRDAEPLFEVTNKVGETQPYTFENPGTYYVDLTAYGPGVTEEGKLMRVDTVVVTPGQSVIPELTAPSAYFPAAYDKANVKAWYSSEKKTEVSAQTDAIFIFNDGTLIITNNVVIADGTATKNITDKVMNMPLIYALTEGSTFENGSMDVGVALAPKYTQATMEKGVLAVSIPTVGDNLQFNLQDNANIPDPSK